MENTLTGFSHLNLRLYNPAAPLRPYIKNYWFISAPENATLRTEYLPCDTGCGITFSFNSRLVMGDSAISQGCLISGPNTTSLPLQLGDQIDAVGIRFHPGMAYPFFQEPLNEFIAPIEPTDRVQQRLELNQIYDTLASNASTAARVTQLDSWLMHLLERSVGVSSELHKALDWLDNQTLQPITSLSEQINLSQRQLERLFKQWVGISPKHYSRLLRVNHARSTLRDASGTLSLTEAALNAGYFDQAHFNREFKQVVGLTPGQYLKCLEQPER
ncbi:helix-turn-helix domain-containing protein [Pontibacterium granulatum]|uniref:helix-turn-helix domain-containing protein n=1 Tax=Pontibacterium granulatum TaxID=2036029 RepID=UPI00249B11A9|nr:helix-turn-helix domain-containing protein [Pontibacterium granulatum]MDI3324090.1 helix-turn-helix domain-containing protein [Pontibacterium granulatum]